MTSGACCAPCCAPYWLVAALNLTPQEVLTSPHLLVGTPEEIAGDLLGFRDRFGISYRVPQDMEPFAEVLSRRAGT